MLEEKLLVFVLGAPGAGKGTQCDLVVKEYGWTHISAGDLLRAQVKAGTPAGKEAEEYLKQGTMVPASMIIGLLKEALSDAKHTKVLIDGFPRVLDQLKEFEKQVRPCDRALFYNIAEEAARERLLQRGKTSGRVDDNEETIRNRFVVFKQESMPVITELEAEGRAVEIDAAQAPEQVFEATHKVIEELQQGLASKAKQQPQQEADGTAAAAEPTPAAAEAKAAEAEAVITPKAAAASSSTASPVAGAAAEVAMPAAAAAAVAAGAAVAAAVAAGDADAPDASSPVKQSAAAAEQAARAADVASPTAPQAGGVMLPTAAQAAGVMSPTAAGVMSPTAAGVMSPTAAGVMSPTAAGVMSPTAAGVMSPTALSVPPPAADAAAAANLPSPKGTLTSLQVDLSGIRTPIVICGPSGVGKGTLISKLMADHADRFGFSVSHTTRGPRPGELHGQHYYFTSIEAMAPQVEAGMFLEHAMVHGNMYGTSLAAVAQVSAAGKHCVLDIDVQGAAQVRKSALGPQCLFIFVAPPSHEELERRLRNRGTETEEKVLKRLANAEAEIAKAQEPGLFNHVLVNGDLEKAYQELVKLVGQRVPGLVLHTEQQQEQEQQKQEQQEQQQQQGGVSNPEAAAAGNPGAAAAAASPKGAPDAAATSPAATPVAAGAAVAGAAAGAAVKGVAAVAAAQLHQQQQQHKLANGNGSTAAPAAGGTATLLDFGFGASAGPAVAAKGMPVRQYMDVTVIPVLREGLKALNTTRPDDPLQFLADYLVAHKSAAA